MVFSMDTVINSKDAKFSTPTVQSDEFNHILSETIDIVMAEQANFLTEMDDIFEEGFDTVINSVKEFDYRSILSKVFDLFISAIERLGGSFCAFLLNFVNKDVQLESFKSQLASFRGNVRYTKPFYEYNHLAADSTISINYKNDIFTLEMGMIADLDKLKVARTSSDLSSMLESLEDKYLNYEDYLSKIRGRLTGNNDISSDEYSDALFNYFRTTKTPIPNKARVFEKNIGPDRIRLAYNNYYGASKQTQLVKREQWKFKAQATVAKANVTRHALLSGIANRSAISVESLLLYNRIVHARCKEIQEVCNIYVAYFSAKLNALSEFNRVNKELLLLACKEITKNKFIKD